MSDIVIQAEKLAKRYRINQARRQSDSLRETISEAFRFAPHAFFSKKPPSEDSDTQWIWALQDVSFTVRRGEAVGIIGRNGAGKSTLLKILSRVTDPSMGRAEIRGRVGSLLEVGTGFHPELTGRENIYLSGAILGMKSSEIARKFDQIAQFSEIPKFLDTPVKHYSSGMYMRLAFSVATHLEPEILIIDEVLGVGDEGFQRKCLQRLGQLRTNGCTILLVSHDLDAVRAVCGRVIWLLDGRIHGVGEVDPIRNQYREYLLEQEQKNRDNALVKVERGGESREGNGIWVKHVDLLDQNNQPRTDFATGEELTVVIRYEANRIIQDPIIGVGIELMDHTICYGCTTLMDAVKLQNGLGERTVELEFEHLNLLPNSYRITVGIWQRDGNVQLDACLDAATFRVHTDRMDLGMYFLKHSWHVSHS